MELARIDISQHYENSGAFHAAVAYDEAQKGSRRETLAALQFELDFPKSDTALVRYLMLALLLMSIVVAWVTPSNPPTAGEFGAAVGLGVLFFAVFLGNELTAWRRRRQIIREIAEIEARPRTYRDDLIVANDFQKACHRVWQAHNDVTLAADAWNNYVNRVALGLRTRFANDETLHQEIVTRLKHVNKMALFTYCLYRSYGVGASHTHKTPADDLYKALDRLDFGPIDDMKSWYQGLTARYASAGFTTD